VTEHAVNKLLMARATAAGLDAPTQKWANPCARMEIDCLFIFKNSYRAKKPINSIKLTALI
jgi:hypothetical protein